MNRYPEWSREYYKKNKANILAKKKKFKEENEEVVKQWRKKYYLKNHKEILKKARKNQTIYRKNNKKKVLESKRKYFSTERGYFVALWCTINRLNGRKKWKTIEQKNGFKNFDEFYNHWLEQKSIYGLKCPATKVKMTTKRFFNKPGERKQKCMTNISVDRILSSRNYSPKNLMFTTWAYNCSKSKLSPKDAKTFLRIVKERYGTDEIE
jgi:hypothetical protein